MLAMRKTMDEADARRIGSIGKTFMIIVIRLGTNFSISAASIIAKTQTASVMRMSCQRVS